MQTSPLFALIELTARTQLCSGTSKLLSSDEYLSLSKSLSKSLAEM